MQTIVLSAFSCAPRGGSELAVGWQALENVRGRFNVYVFTDISCQKHFLPGELAQLAEDGVRIFFYEQEGFLSCLTQRLSVGRTLYYWLWQDSLPSFCWNALDESSIDLIHHVTWAKFTIPTRLKKNETPTIVGPVGGGETFPYCLARVLSLRGLGLELLRTVSLEVLCRLPSFRKTYEDADLILASTSETAQWINRFAPLSRVRIMTQVSVNPKPSAEENDCPSDGLQVLSVGRFLDWKGFSLVMEAFFRAGPSVSKLVLVGDGPERKRLEELSARLAKKGKSIHFTGWLSQPEVEQFFQQSDLFCFGSLHDSGGFVVLEAMAAGLPVVCMDCGGPANFVTEETGAKISPNLGRKVEERFAVEMERFSKMSSEQYASYSDAARLQAQQFSSDSMKEKIDCIYREHGLIG